MQKFFGRVMKRQNLEVVNKEVSCAEKAEIIPAKILPNFSCS
jgi:hypothetical protein